jgi:hypothetical protein
MGELVYTTFTLTIPARRTDGTNDTVRQWCRLGGIGNEKPEDVYRLAVMVLLRWADERDAVYGSTAGDPPIAFERVLPVEVASACWFLGPHNPTKAADWLALGAAMDNAGVTITSRVC